MATSPQLKEAFKRSWITAIATAIGAGGAAAATTGADPQTTTSTSLLGLVVPLLTRGLYEGRKDAQRQENGEVQESDVTEDGESRYGPLEAVASTWIKEDEAEDEIRKVVGIRVNKADNTVEYYAAKEGQPAAWIQEKYVIAVYSSKPENAG